MKKIYLGLTTTWGSDWRQKCREIDELNIRELTLFPTAIDLSDRRELFKLLADTSLERIPFVHLRTDMKREEIDWLIEKYGVEIFNLHPSQQALDFLKENKDLAPQIYVENCLSMEYFEETLAECAGICLDISHYEDFALRQNCPGQNRIIELLKTQPVGCTHMPAVRAEKYEAITHGKSFMVFESHTMEKLSEMDYIVKHKNFLSDYNAIELNNSFSQQLEVKKYLETILNLK